MQQRLSLENASKRIEGEEQNDKCLLQIILLQPPQKRVQTTDHTKKELAKLGIGQGWIGQAKGVCKIAVCGRGTKCAAVLKVNSCLMVKELSTTGDLEYITRSPLPRLAPR